MFKLCLMELLMRKQNWVLDMSRDIYHGRTVKEMSNMNIQSSKMKPTK